MDGTEQKKHSSVPKDFWTYWTRHQKVNDGDIIIHSHDEHKQQHFIKSNIIIDNNNDLNNNESLFNNTTRKNYYNNGNRHLEHIWHMLAMIFLSIGSVFLWNYIGPSHIPWFIIVISLFSIVWIMYLWLPGIISLDNIYEKKRRIFILHLLINGTVNLSVILYWSFLSYDNKRPWFLFVMAGSCLPLIIHFSISFINLRKYWIIPQLYIYFLASAVTFFIWFFYEKRTKDWFIIPISVWGLLIAIQVGIFLFLRRRRRNKKKNRRSYQNKSVVKSENTNLLIEEGYFYNNNNSNNTNIDINMTTDDDDDDDDDDDEESSHFEEDELLTTEKEDNNKKLNFLKKFWRKKDDIDSSQFCE